MLKAELRDGSLSIAFKCLKCGSVCAGTDPNPDKPGVYWREYGCATCGFFYRISVKVRGGKVYGQRIDAIRAG